MINPVETKHASLDTLSVTIQALHVAGKQMTLSVFRQLPCANECDTADPWGTVRYKIKDEGDLWLVFSQAGRLYRRPLLIHKYEHKVYAMAPEAKRALDTHNMRVSYMKGDKDWERKKLELTDALARLIEEDREFRNAAAASHAEELELNATLPQLFIAV